MKDWEPFKLKPLPVGSGKGADKVLGDKALFTLGGTDGFRTRVVPLPTGGHLRVKTKNGMPEYIYEPGKAGVGATPDVSMTVIATLVARLASLYMTSGAYAFGALGGVNQSDPMLTVEPVTYKSDAVAATEAAELVPHYDKTPPASGQVSKIYNHTVNPGGLNAPKLAMWNRRPSEFSGLMRRCMQGRYGSGNTSHNMVLGESSGSVSVGASFSRTTGILKFEDDYVFVIIESGAGTLTVSWAPLLIPGEYVEVYASNPCSATETLALGQAYVLEPAVREAGSAAIPSGLPLSFGWSFSETTNKAACVINEPLAYGYDRRMYSLLELSFTYDTTLHFTYSLTEQVDGWINPGKAPIWVSFAGVSYWYNMRLNTPDPDSVQDFPVYAFYDVDFLCVVRWRWSAGLVQFDPYDFEAKVTAARESNSVFGHGSCSAVTSADAGDVVTHGFFIAGRSSPPTSASDRYVSSGTMSLAYVTEPPDEWPEGTPIGARTGCLFMEVWSPGSRTSYNPYVYPDGSSALGDPKPASHYYSGVRTVTSGSVENRSERVVRSHSTALVIPSLDCCAVYIGKKVRDYGSANCAVTTGLSGYGRVDEWQMELETVSPPGVYPPVNKWIPTGRWYPAVTRQFTLKTHIAANMLGGGATESFSETVDRVDLSISLHRYGGEFVVGGEDSEIFHPNVFYPYLSVDVAVVTSSIYYECLYNCGSLADMCTTDSYPTDITLFVGAS